MKKNNISEKGEKFCLVCGERSEKGNLCECCRESLALIDIDNFITQKNKGIFFGNGVSNAFNDRDFMVK